MIEPNISDDDHLRSLEIERLGLVYSPAEDRFDRITRLAQAHFSAPIVLVSMIYKDIQWVKSLQGVYNLEEKRENAFCSYVVLQKAPLVVEDPIKDPRFSNNPLVLKEPGVRFYAGVPVRSPQGVVLGAICVIDHHPRSFSQQDLQELNDFAALVESEFYYRLLSTEQNLLLKENDELKRKSMLDSLTSTWNELAIVELLNREMALARRSLYALSVLVIDIDGFKSINKTYGQTAGDECLKQLAQQLKSVLRISDVVGRLGRDEFLAILPKAAEQEARFAVDRLVQRLQTSSVQLGENRIAISVAVGISTQYATEEHVSPEKLLASAEKMLCDVKLLTSQQSTIQQSVVGFKSSAF